MAEFAVFARPIPRSLAREIENRVTNRYPCDQEAVTQALDAAPPVSWGATVKNVSAGGMGVVLCFPFKPGTHLAIVIQSLGIRRTYLVRVVHVLDQSDGTWFVGCEFARRLHDDEIDEILRAS